MKLRPLLAPLLLLSATALAADPLPGEYITEHGGGTLTVTRAGDALDFHIFVVGGNGHMCDLAGTIRSGEAVLEEGGDKCVVSFKPFAGGVEVGSSGGEGCRYYCGMRAMFEGNYLKPAKGCTDSERKRTRAGFKRLYDRHEWTEALATLQPLLADCEKTLDWLEAGRVRNDLAVTLHKLQRFDECRAVLAPLAEDAAATDKQVQENYPPSDAENYLPIVKSTRTNLRLCGGERKPAR